ncbi:MAG: peptide MFS transporter [Gammaproteobacteria bacterium]
MAADDPRAERWGHPAGLPPLFFTELWERFSFYGMRGLLMLYMTRPLADGGLAFDTARAGATYGLYASLVYVACLPGGWLADRLLGTRRATFLGALAILCGHLCLAWPAANTFYVGLGFVIVGTGLLKPSVSTMVGQLYAPDDPRRDSGFSLYYMGINLGAFLAPLVCGWLALAPPFRAFLVAQGIAPELAWHFGFGAAAVGMTLGLVTFARGTRHYAAASAGPALTPTATDRRRAAAGLGLVAAATALLTVLLFQGVLTVAALSNLFGAALLLVTGAFFAWIFVDRGWSAEERRNLRLIFALFLGAVIFWSLLEQTGSTFTLFAERDTDRHLDLLGYAFPPNWFHALNPLLVIALAPVFAWGWVRLGPHNPPASAKFLVGLTLAVAGFGVMIAAATLAAQGVKVSPGWLIAAMTLHTLGELCLSPVGLSAMTRLAPARIAGLTMGVWFLGASVGNYFGGRVASLYDTFALPDLFSAVTMFGLVATGALAVVLRRWSRG